MSITGAKGGAAILTCDHCGRTEVLHDPGLVVVLTEGWLAIRLDGWVGDFHACSDVCHAGVLRDYTAPLRGRTS